MTNGLFLCYVNGCITNLEVLRPCIDYKYSTGSTSTPVLLINLPGKEDIGEEDTAYKK